MKATKSVAGSLGILLLLGLPIAPFEPWMAPAAYAAPQQGVAAASFESLSEEASTTITIPGPLGSFLRMAAISQKAPLGEVLPLLARNVVIDGYQHGQGKTGKPTEFLRLLQAYLDQARELQEMAGAQGRIHIRGCGEEGPLLQTLGYRLRAMFGPVHVETRVEAREEERFGDLIQVYNQNARKIMHARVIDKNTVIITDKAGAKIN